MGSKQGVAEEGSPSSTAGRQRSAGWSWRSTRSSGRSASGTDRRHVVRPLGIALVVAACLVLLAVATLAGTAGAGDEEPAAEFSGADGDTLEIDPASVDPNVTTSHDVSLVVADPSPHDGDWLSGIGIRYVDVATNLGALDAADVTVTVDGQDVESDDGQALAVHRNDDMLELHVEGEDGELQTQLSSGAEIAVAIEGLENPATGEHELASKLVSAEDSGADEWGSSGSDGWDQLTTASTTFGIDTDPTLAVASVDATEAYPGAAPTDLVVEVRNDGYVADEQPVTVAVAGDVVAEKPVALEAGETESLVVENVTLPFDAGLHAVSAATATDDWDEDGEPIDLAASVADATVDLDADPTTELTVESATDDGPAPSELLVTAEGLDAETLASILSLDEEAVVSQDVVVAEAGDAWTTSADFAGVEPGTYEFRATDAAAPGVATATVEVQDGGGSPGGGAPPGSGGDGDADADDGDDEIDEVSIGPDTDLDDDPEAAQAEDGSSADDGDESDAGDGFDDGSDRGLLDALPPLWALGGVAAAWAIGLGYLVWRP